MPKESNQLTSAEQHAQEAVMRLPSDRQMPLVRVSNEDAPFVPDHVDEFSVSPDEQVESSGLYEWESSKLPDHVAEPESVIGNDDRVRVNNTMDYPWSAVCHLEIINQDLSKSTGTGWIIGRHALATAAHNIYNHRHGGLAQDIRILPGRNETAAMFDIKATDYDLDPRWLSHWGDNRHDYGALFFSQPNIIDKTGTFGYRRLSDSDLTSLNIANVGYPYSPGEKPFGSLWRNKSRISNVSDVAIGYTLDTEGGHSGSPIFRWSSSNLPEAVGIHTTGFPDRNEGRRIDSELSAAMSSWRNYPNTQLLRATGV